MVENQIIEPYPQIVRHAFLVIVAILLSIALRRIDGFIDSKDDLGNGNLPHILGEAIAPSRPSYAVDQRTLTQASQIIAQDKIERFADAD